MLMVQDISEALQAQVVEAIEHKVSLAIRGGGTKDFYDEEAHKRACPQSKEVSRRDSEEACKGAWPSKQGNKQTRL